MEANFFNKPYLKLAQTESERQSAIAMLQGYNLPVSDIDDKTLLYVLVNNDKVIGTAGLEILDTCALLRSVSIAKEVQGKGYGRIINDGMEKFAKEKGVNCMCLLTTTAQDFFNKQGYCVINRDDVPDEIKQTAEFSSLCPSSAVLMQKRI